LSASPDKSIRLARSPSGVTQVPPRTILIEAIRGLIAYSAGPGFYRAGLKGSADLCSFHAAHSSEKEFKRRKKGNRKKDV
jgi:hypothetical protein